MEFDLQQQPYFYGASEGVSSAFWRSSAQEDKGASHYDVEFRRNLSRGSIHGCGPADQIVQRESRALHSTIDDGGLLSILAPFFRERIFLLEPRSVGSFDRFDYPWQDNY
jgi:hypothetical protein